MGLIALFLKSVHYSFWFDIKVKDYKPFSTSCYTQYLDYKGQKVAGVLNALRLYSSDVQSLQMKCNLQLNSEQTQCSWVNFGSLLEWI